MGIIMEMKLVLNGDNLSDNCKNTWADDLHGSQSILRVFFTRGKLAKIYEVC